MRHYSTISKTPFGRSISEMSFSSDTLGKYRYGFNNQEKDGELGDYYAFEYRMSDSRLGRFLSVDPLAPEYPWYSPYQFAGNTPIWAIELEGLEPAMTSTANVYKDAASGNEFTIFSGSVTTTSKGLITGYTNPFTGVKMVWNSIKADFDAEKTPQILDTKNNFNYGYVPSDNSTDNTQVAGTKPKDTPATTTTYRGPCIKKSNPNAQEIDEKTKAILTTNSFCPVVTDLAKAKAYNRLGMTGESLVHGMRAVAQGALLVEGAGTLNGLKIAGSGGLIVGEELTAGGLTLENSVSKVMGEGYKTVGEVSVPIKNTELMGALNKSSTGDWVKVYEAGIQKGNKIEVHYFRNNTTGQVFEVKAKYNYWHQKAFSKIGG